MTKQDWLDDLYKASSTGQFPGYSVAQASCRLRGDGGRKCVWGRLIPDEKYEVGMEENGSIHTFWHKYPAVTLACLPVCVSVDDMSDIQAIHDKLAIQLSKYECGVTSSNWDHDHFMERILATNTFKGMVPSGCAAPTG